MITWIILLFVDGINGLPDGAPIKACSTLLPVHKDAEPQTTKSPFEIIAEVSGPKVTIQITSPDGIEKIGGFMLQARSSNDPKKFVDGTFTSSDISKTIDCFNGSRNTLTHVNAAPKVAITTEWTPKENLNEEIIFRATLARKFDTFWTEVDSNPVILGNDSVSLVKEELLYEQCFKEKGCIGLPNDCVEREDCEILLKYSKSTEGITFILKGFLESSNYMAMAVSQDPKMGEDSVTECIVDGTNVIARESWNEGKSNTRTKEFSKDRFIGSFVDGIASCSWTSPLVTVSNGQTYNFANEKFYVLLATGKVMEWRLKYHDKRISTHEALNLTKISEDAPDPEMETSSDKSSEFDHPTTLESKTQENIGDKSETSTGSNQSSFLSTCLGLLITGLFFTIKETMNVYIF